MIKIKIEKERKWNIKERKKIKTKELENEDDYWGCLVRKRKKNAKWYKCPKKYIRYKYWHFCLYTL